MPVAKKSSGIRWITRDEANAIVDARARRVLNISGAEFVEKWRAGEFRTLDSDQCPGVIELALLAPESRRSGGRKKQKRGNR